MPSSVIIAEVAGGTLNSSAANFKTAVKGVASGTLRTLKGSLGSDVKVILKVTLDAAAIVYLLSFHFTGIDEGLIIGIFLELWLK